MKYIVIYDHKDNKSLSLASCREYREDKDPEVHEPHKHDVIIEGSDLYVNHNAIIGMIGYIGKFTSGLLEIYVHDDSKIDEYEDSHEGARRFFDRLIDDCYNGNEKLFLRDFFHFYADQPLNNNSNISLLNHVFELMEI